MKTKLLIGLLILTIVLLSGCAEKECKTDTDCLAKTCFTVQCADNKCVYSPLNGKQPGCSEEFSCGGEACKEGVCEVDYEKNCCGNEICEVGETYPECAADCPNCDDANECTTDSYDYHKHECVNTIIPNQICCGNAICETGETYTNCAQDCPNCDDDNDCTEDSYDYHEQKCVNELIIPCCGNDICDEETAETYSSCPIDCPNCDDEDECTEDSYEYREQKCIHKLIIPCCGNNICDEETAETYSSCPIDCPDCDDNNKITADSFNYETRGCDNRIDLRIFPEPFVVDGVYDSSNAFVFGSCGAEEQSAGMDVIDKMFLEESTTSTTGTVSQVIGSDVLAEPEKRHDYNLIFVGGPCCNPLVGEIFGMGCEDWVEFHKDESWIVLMKNGEDKVALLVASYTADDAVAIAEVLADYKNSDLTGTEFTIKG